jgi:hypothetical protein
MPNIHSRAILRVTPAVFERYQEQPSEGDIVGEGNHHNSDAEVSIIDHKKWDRGKCWKRHFMSPTNFKTITPTDNTIDILWKVKRVRDIR